MSEFLYMINLKHYSESTGKNAERMAREFSNLNSKMKRNLRIALSTVDLHICSEVKNAVSFMAQHVDPVSYGAYTGKISMESLMVMGISTSLLNHSENRQSRENIVETVKRSNKIDFDIVLCLESLREVEEYVDLHPAYIAYEPPELIGGEISVSSARPEVIEKAARICNANDVPLVVGAGIKNARDVEESYSLGARGILVASGVVKANNPSFALNSLMTVP
ncbi:MAG: triose-phosphate isomerase [Thermoplasmataceae archaeon]